jgi:hypothetical protein
MNKSKTPTDIGLLIACLCLLLLLSTGPAAAQSGQRVNSDKSGKAGKVIGSLYCVEGTVTIKGWERQLIERDPALAKFHWSPITAAQPGRIYFRQPISVNRLKPYHNLKPQLISFDQARALRQKKARNSRGQSQAISVQVYRGICSIQRGQPLRHTPAIQLPHHPITRLNRPPPPH